MLAVLGHRVDAATGWPRPTATGSGSIADLQRLGIDLGHADVGRGVEVGAFRAWRGSGPKSWPSPAPVLPGNRRHGENDLVVLRLPLGRRGQIGRRAVLVLADEFQPGRGAEAQLDAARLDADLLRIGGRGRPPASRRSSSRPTGNGSSFRPARPAGPRRSTGRSGPRAGSNTMPTAWPVTSSLLNSPARMTLTSNRLPTGPVSVPGAATSRCGPEPPNQQRGQQQEQQKPQQQCCGAACSCGPADSGASPRNSGTSGSCPAGGQTTTRTPDRCKPPPGPAPGRSADSPSTRPAASGFPSRDSGRNSCPGRCGRGC